MQCETKPSLGSNLNEQVFLRDTSEKGSVYSEVLPGLDTSPV